MFFCGPSPGLWYTIRVETRRAVWEDLQLNSSVISSIEENFGCLSRAEQLSLLERLVHQISADLASEQTRDEASLEAMAADPQIQRELRKISEEFALAETDGLDGV